jgi:hypothetical protein
LKKKSLNCSKQGLFPRRKALSIYISAALMAAPLSVIAAPPDTPPVQVQSDQTRGEALRPGVNAPAFDTATLAEIRKLLEFPFELEEFPGIQAGSFLLFPQVTLSETYDDNIYAEPGNFTNRSYPVDDFITTLSPSIQARSAWDKHSLTFDAGADIARYADHSSENVNDYYFGTEGRYDLSKTANVFGGVRFSHDHEDRGSEDALGPGASAEPTRYDEVQYHLGTEFKLGKHVTVRAGGAYTSLDFKDFDYRDRKLDSLGARVSYEINPTYNVFAQYATDNRTYDLASTGRDSDGYRVAVGWGYNLGNKVQGELFVGHLSQNFENAAYADVSKPYFGANVTWKKNTLTQLSAFVDRTLDETILPGASSYLDTTVGGRIEHRLSAKTTALVRAAYTHSQFQGVDRLDRIGEAGIGLRHYVVPTVYLGFDYRMVTRDSNVLIADYARNQVFVSVGYTPARSRDYAIFPETTATAEPVVGGYSGFYAGAQIGHGALTTETWGPRDGGGFDTSDYGNFGESYALFAGWGKEINHWYLGLDVDGGNSNARWDHSKTPKPDSRTMYVAKDASYGMSARVGYLLDGGLLYGKLGLVRTDFHTYYTENQYATTGAFNKDHSETGTRWGVGLEIPASSNLFVRMDYSHTTYPGYGVPYQTSGGGAITIEDFKVKDNVFGVGIGWRFDGERPALATLPPSKLQGFYVGGALGHDTLNTKLTGTQYDSGGTEGPYDFYGDFANSNAEGGIFAGYGFTLNRIYLGLELEAEAANFGWYQERTVAGEGGRDFAEEKRSSYGAGLRVGYILNNGSLLYARAGKVRSRFITTYNKGAGSGNPSPWINRLDKLDGTRIGFGAEVPAYRNAFVRMDYSYTKYDSFSFVTTNGIGSGTPNPDAMTFQDNENLFSLGLGLRF